MAKARTPRSAWIDAALEALAAGGPDAVRIETLATSLGVTKGGFYWHFKDRHGLLDEMLDTWEKTVVEDVIARVDSQPDDPRGRLRHLSAMVSPATLAQELAVRDWARRDKAIAERLRGVDQRRMEYLRSLFRPICADEGDVEARCLLVFSLFVGSAFIGVQHGDRNRGQVVELAIERLLADTPLTPAGAARRSRRASGPR